MKNKFKYIMLCGSGVLTFSLTTHAEDANVDLSSPTEVSSSIEPASKDGVSQENSTNTEEAISSNVNQSSSESISSLVSSNSEDQNTEGVIAAVSSTPTDSESEGPLNSQAQADEKIEKEIKADLIESKIGATLSSSDEEKEQTLTSVVSEIKDSLGDQSMGESSKEQELSARAIGIMMNDPGKEPSPEQAQKAEDTMKEIHKLVASGQASETFKNTPWAQSAALANQSAAGE